MSKADADTDLAFYGLGLNNTIVLSAIGYSNGDTIYHTLRNNAIGNIVLVCAGSMPGYWLSVLTIDTIGRKPIQILGFLILTILFTIIGFTYNSLSKGSLLALYILAQLFFNFGPNTTTFIIPGECFPTRYRSTGHGLSAAMGKIGAIVAQVIAQPLLKIGAAPDCKGSSCHPWLNHLMQIFALFMLCGTLVSFLVPETKGRTLEELAGEHPLHNHHAPTPSNPSRWSWLQIFHGGKPAGFKAKSSPNLGPRSPGIRGKRQRFGIMTSPELIPKRGEKTKHGRGASYESSAAGTHSVSSHGRDLDDDYLSMNRDGNAKSPRLPGWGVGWDVRGGDGGTSGEGWRESILLYDVGKLLK